MARKQIKPESVQDTDGSDDTDGRSGGASYPSSDSIPEPGSIFIIRSVSSRRVVTLLKGQVVLAPPASFGSPYWECMGTEGWLGFRNVASSGLLGRDGPWLLCCSVRSHREWEKFHVGSRAEGGHVLLMTHWGTLRPVGSKEENGEQKLAMLENGSTDGIVWEFVKV
ncbi:hypothetical protein MMC18_002777 [Xylographa bjoerkii]|nr:hypothetical protein [Xylographa bjoerkii]